MGGFFYAFIIPYGNGTLKDRCNTKFRTTDPYHRFKVITY